MTIQLPPDVENSLLAKVHSGLFPSLDAAMTRAAHLLLEQIEQTSARSKGKGKPPKSVKASGKPRTPEELNQRLFAAGLISQLPDPLQDLDDDDPADQPVKIKGEPLSETILRERR
jgi:hypothetical protein